jgi:hypothetical protein
MLNERLPVRLGEARHFIFVYRNLAHLGCPVEVEDGPGFRIVWHLGVTGDKVGVEVGEAFTHRRGVDPQGAGKLFKEPLEMAEGGTEVGRLFFIKVGNAGNMPLAVEHEPSRHADARGHASNEPEVVLEYRIVQGIRSTDSTGLVKRWMLHASSLDRYSGLRAALGRTRQGNQRAGIRPTLAPGPA